MGLANLFNNLFGSNITYVSNAYSNAEYVWLLFHNEALSLDNITLSGTPKVYDVEVDAHLESKKVTEKVRVPFGDFHKKRRNASYEYISIYAKNKDGQNVKICQDYGIDANRSFIITNEGGIKPQKYGCSNLWMDEFDFDHYPKRVIS